MLGVVTTNLAIADEEVEEDSEIECRNCGNGCNVEKNCGRSSCGAVSGSSCGCKR